MKLWNRLVKQSFPTWEVSDAEIDPVDPTIIRVKVKKPLPKDSHIKIKGNAIGSGWMRMRMNFYWLNGQMMRIRQVDKETCSQLIKFHAKVRVPELEQQHADDIRRQVKRLYRENKR